MHRRLLLPLATLCLAVLPAIRTAQAGERRAVPEVIDLPTRAAQAELSAAGFTSKVAEVDGEPAGTVGRQLPGGFSWADTSTTVTIFVRRGTGPAVPSPESGPTPTPSPGPTSVPVPNGPPGPTLPPPTQLPSTVPNVIGRTESDALDLLRNYRVTVMGVDATAGNEGRIVEQSPVAGQPLAAGQTVTLSVARAGAPPPGAASVPDVVGLEQDAAAARLSQARLVPLVNLVASDPSSAGKVVSQEPSAGVIVARDSNVMLGIGRPASTPLTETEVPDLIHLTEVEARARLTTAGLEVIVQDVLTPAASSNTVLRQDPAPGTRLPRGRAVTVTVGRLLLLPLTVPDTLNMDAMSAEKALVDAGFTVVRAMTLSLAGSAGRVVAQDPAGGGTAIRGRAIRISIGQAPPGAGGSVPVPNLVGRSEAQARADLAATGLGARTRLVDGAPGAAAGTVARQSVGAGSSMPRGGEVVLEVVRGGAASTAGIPVPGYVGGDAASAQSDLASRGFSVVIMYVGGTPEGRVVGQDPAPGTMLQSGGRVTLSVSRAPTLPQVTLLQPATGTSIPRNYGVTFYWNPVPEAEDYQFEIFVWKDDTWVQADNDIERNPQKRPSKVKKGTYQWHIRARRGGGSIMGPWSEWRRLTIY